MKMLCKCGHGEYPMFIRDFPLNSKCFVCWNKKQSTSNDVVIGLTVSVISGLKHDIKFLMDNKCDAENLKQALSKVKMMRIDGAYDLSISDK